MAYPQTSFICTEIDPDCLLGKRREVVIEHTLRYQLDVLKSTGRYDAFKLKWHPIYDEEPLVPPVPKHLFWDSDVGKWIEGACYYLAQRSLPDIDAAVKDLVDMIARAQQDDGYLNIHYIVVAPGKRWTNLKDMHELYNAGHLIEGALAHENVYHNGKFLNVMLKYVDLIDRTFGPEDNQLHGYPGHPEIELALLRLYEHTKDPKHLALARFFLTERGNAKGQQGQHYYDWEAEQRGQDPTFRPAFYPEVRSHWYHQAHEPIVSQQTIEGHSVRAVYLMTAYTDLLRIDGDAPKSERQVANHRLWDNMVERKTYVTGGIGAIRQWEGFGGDFFLPQSLDEGGCYSETCAAIGVMMWAQRMLTIELDGRIGDIMELCLYNAVLTSMSHNGKAFTYHNQLASSDNDLDKRCDWFTVACCPPNIMRLLGQIGGYVWDFHGRDQTGEDGVPEVVAHLFVSSTFHLPGDGKTSISQTTQWPWDDTINFAISGSSPFTLKVRVPSWAADYQLEPKCPDRMLKNGYLSIPSAWLASNQKMSLKIPLFPRWIAPPIQTGQDIAALARGPVVYCVEDIDNDWVQDHFKTTYIDTQAPVAAKPMSDPETWVALTLKDGCRSLSSERTDRSPFTDLANRKQKLRAAKVVPSLHFVPYALRSNRGGRGHMRVGLRLHSPKDQHS